MSILQAVIQAMDYVTVILVGLVSNVYMDALWDILAHTACRHVNARMKLYVMQLMASAAALKDGLEHIVTNHVLLVNLVPTVLRFAHVRMVLRVIRSLESVSVHQGGVDLHAQMNVAMALLEPDVGILAVVERMVYVIV